MSLCSLLSETELLRAGPACMPGLPATPTEPAWRRQPCPSWGNNRLIHLWLHFALDTFPAVSQGPCWDTPRLHPTLRSPNLIQAVLCSVLGVGDSSAQMCGILQGPDLVAPWRAKTNRPGFKLQLSYLAGSPLKPFLHFPDLSCPHSRDTGKMHISRDEKCLVQY